VTAARAPVGSGAPFLANPQILRFIAAAMVLIHHLLLELQSPRLAAPLVDPTRVEWSIGVDVFFMVSGFILYFLTRDHFAERGYPGQFLLRRFVRVVPLYWLFTSLMILSILAAGGMVSHGDLNPGRVASSYLFWPWPRADGAIFPLLGLGWTLNYEVLFYLSYALALGLPRRWGLVGLFGAFALAAVVGRFAPRGWVAVRFWSDPMILEFPLGILLARLHLAGARPPTWARLTLVAAGLGLSSALSRLGIVDPGMRLIWGGAPALLIAAGVMLGAEPDPGARLTRALVLGGGASYALYLTHMFSLRLLTALWARLGFGAPLAYLGVGLALATAVAVGVHLWVETPVLEAFHRLIGRGAVGSVEGARR